MTSTNGTIIYGRRPSRVGGSASEYIPVWRYANNHARTAGSPQVIKMNTITKTSCVICRFTTYYETTYNWSQRGRHYWCEMCCVEAFE